MHIPVMMREAVEWLAIRPEGVYVDATAGAGGHSRAILEKLTTGRLIALDKDPWAIEIARENLLEHAPKLTQLQEDFGELLNVLRRLELSGVDGILADLGLSQMQIDSPERGFSFRAEGPLDMRMDPRQRLTADDIVNHFDERQVADLIYNFGEERRSLRIARAIVRARPIRNTIQLANLIETCLGGRRDIPKRKAREGGRGPDNKKTYSPGNTNFSGFTDSGEPGTRFADAIIKRRSLLSGSRGPARHYQLSFIGRSPCETTLPAMGPGGRDAQSDASRGQTQSIGDTFEPALPQRAPASRRAAAANFFNRRTGSTRCFPTYTLQVKVTMREIYYVKPIDNSRLRPVMDPRAPRQYLAILALASVVFGAIMLSAWQRFDDVQDGYRLEALQGENQQFMEANRKLRLEEAYLGDPVRIDTIARNELGMMPLAPPQIIAGEPAAPVTDSSVLADARRPPLPSQVKNVAAAVP